MTIFVEAEIVVEPLTNAAFDRFVKNYAEVWQPVICRHGWDLVGAWKRTGGSLNTIIHLYRFESLAHFDELRELTRSDPALAAAMEHYSGLEPKETVLVAQA